MTEADYRFISQAVYQECGIVLSDHKKDMVYSRLARRIRLLKLKNFSQYIQYVEDNKSLEFGELINAITTNLTSFFRESHHFDFLKQKVIPELKVLHKSDKRVRVWSAGCSTGMEPYSISITMLNQFPASWDVKILATDLDTNVLKTAKSGIYESQNLTGLNDQILKQHFLHDSSGQQYKVKSHLQKLITFKQLNLLETWPMKGPFDVIFCRNVVIYFDTETKNQLFKRYARLLRPNGYLILGHSETMSRHVNEFEAIGRTIYRKVSK